MQRRHNFQTVSWFWDLYQRRLIELDPPYQRRSVWNQAFKEYFVDTILLVYPAPAIFLFEEISPDGRSKYNVVDGKQRLTAAYEFIEGVFPISETSALTALRGKYFAELSDEVKRNFWSYQFLVEYLPANDDSLINNIFDRINRNVAKLTAQELRHARFDGEFISSAEALTEWMGLLLPSNFPRFGTQSRKQMKDVEFVSSVLLLLEDGPRGNSQADLDRAFALRDESWDSKNEIEDRFRNIITYLKSVFEADPSYPLYDTRLRNQADLYSLIGAINEITPRSLPNPRETAATLYEFMRKIEDEQIRGTDGRLQEYFIASRSNSNDKGPRETRIRIIREVIESTL